MPSRHRPASYRQVLQDEPTYGSLTRKKTGGTGLSHMHMSCKNCAKKRQAVPRVMQKTVRVMQKKRASCSTCEKNKLFHMQKPCKTVQKTGHVLCSCKKPCKNHAKCGAYGAQPAEHHSPGSLLYVLSVLYLKPLNIHSPRVPCYMCNRCYISQGKPLNIHSPCKPLNIHSPRVPCYMCYMCYMV